MPDRLDGRDRRSRNPHARKAATAQIGNGLAHIPIRPVDLIDENMLKLLNLERFLIDRMTPSIGKRSSGGR
ncbi:hypothetical protein MPC4_70157 [Methylocella tundrae]|uniref:Uncharacterized protein n=1 Tax=Methylocella tundrae TaxID=227605 RepID=A0A8B6MCY5_METTU|nr:hypothetical protein MPC4_70157 [Methylocella tundrae]